MNREQIEGTSPKPKLSRIEEHDTSEEEPDEDDIFLHELERENKMLEGVLKDLQGVIKNDGNNSIHVPIFKDKIEYSFERQRNRDKDHFSSIKQVHGDSPDFRSSPPNRNEKNSKLRQSNENSSAQRKHNFKRSVERDSVERSASSKKHYENSTKSAKSRNFIIRRKSKDQAADEEAESMEMQPPLPHNHDKLK